jgi:prophage maintenance system killer protein
MKDTHMPGKDTGKMVLYVDKGGKTRVEVQLDKDTLWLNQKQISELFDVERSVVTKHLGAIFKSEELIKESVCAFFAHTAADGKVYKTAFYNLDAVISVGYRVNSRRATQFRIWATDILRRHLVEGYTLNQKLLKAKEEKFESLQRAIALMESVKARKPLEYREAMGLLDVIRDYSRAMGLLDDYDHGRVAVRGVSAGARFRLTLGMALKAVRELKGGEHAGGLFGLEKDKSFQSSIDSIYQTFSGRELYPSAEEKAAHLLYFVVKNHSFVDGNKRIGAALFLWFLEKNRLLYRADGGKRLADNALVALTLMIAESSPKDRDLMVRLVVNLINKEN